VIGIRWPCAQTWVPVLVYRLWLGLSDVDRTCSSAHAADAICLLVARSHRTRRLGSLPGLYLSKAAQATDCVRRGSLAGHPEMVGG
jgi:hypothetical protein